MKASEISQKLNEAADLIAQCGWWNGSDPLGKQQCAGTAIDDVCGPSDPDDVHEAFAAYLDLPSGDDAPRRIIAWNDYQADGEAVIEALRGAAKAVRESSDA